MEKEWGQKPEHLLHSMTDPLWSVRTQPRMIPVFLVETTRWIVIAFPGEVNSGEQYLFSSELTERKSCRFKKSAYRVDEAVKTDVIAMWCEGR